MSYTMKLLLGSALACSALNSALAQESKAPAPDKQSVIMVLDGSGSMWGQIDGTPKIEIARDVIGDLLKDWDTSVELGLIAYGHRKKGACDDIETLTEVGPVSADAIMTKVKAINPVGKTPISASVRKAAESLKYTEEKATVILVSDGLETCNADPCALAKELESGGIDFTAHVIGFDVAKEDRAKLSCLAEETGGQFFSAENSGELNDALQKTVEAVAEPAPPPAPKPVETVDVSAEEQGINLRAKLCEDCDLLDEKLYWVVKEPSDLGDGKTIFNTGEDQPFIELVPGDYDVSVRHGATTRWEKFTVGKGQAETLIINLDAGYAQISATATEDGEVLDKGMYYKIYNAEKGLDGNQKLVTNTGDDQPLLRLPVGDYTVKARHGQADAQKQITVKAGERNDYVINMNVGYYKLTTVFAEGGKPISKGLYYKVFSNESDLAGNRKLITNDGAEKPTFKLPAGDYVVQSKHDRAYGEIEISVDAGAMGEGVIVLGAGQVKMKAVLEEGSDAVVKKVHWKIYEAKQGLDGKREFVGNSGSKSPIFTLIAGDYYVTAKHGGKLFNTEFSIDAGEEKTETIVVNIDEE